MSRRFRRQQLREQYQSPRGSWLSVFFWMVAWVVIAYPGYYVYAHAIGNPFLVLGGKGQAAPEWVTTAWRWLSHPNESPVGFAAILAYGLVLSLVGLVVTVQTIKAIWRR